MATNSIFAIIHYYMILKKEIVSKENDVKTLQNAVFGRICRRGEREVEKYLNGWRDSADVEIPPRKANGFREEILIREKILPLPKIQHTGEKEQQEDQRAGKAYVIRMRTDEKTEVNKSPFVMGKSVHADYTIQGNQAISRKHAYVFGENGAYFLKDLNSLNHTFVDGKKIQGQTRLKDGEFFYLADEKFQFRID